MSKDPILPTDSAARKEIPIFSGVLNYFPLAIAAVARLSKRGNDKHNPGQPLHWAREKSTDHADCIARHLIDVETIDLVTGEYEDAVALAWRALANLQVMEERRLGKPMSRGSKAPLGPPSITGTTEHAAGVHIAAGETVHFKGPITGWPIGSDLNSLSRPNSKSRKKR